MNWLPKNSTKTRLQQLIELFHIKSNILPLLAWQPIPAVPLYPGNDDSLLYFPKKTYEHYFGKLKDTSTLKLTVAPGYQPDQVLKETIKTLSQQGTMKNSGTYQEYNVKDTIKEMGSLLNNLTLFISAIAAISLVIAGVGVMNMMYISVSERIKEIGIRRALGGTASDIKKQFLTEGIALTLIGGITGYLLGMIIAYLASMALPFSVRPDLMTVSLAIGISVFIGVVFSYFPASAASKKTWSILWNKYKQQRNSHFWLFFLVKVEKNPKISRESS